MMNNPGGFFASRVFTQIYPASEGVVSFLDSLLFLSERDQGFGHSVLHGRFVIAYKHYRYIVISSRIIRGIDQLAAL
jgi:hypothetical protein